MVAVDGLTIEAPVGRITGLIGPNGAGKTTTFNAACGLVRAQQGSVLLNGADITRSNPAARARRGLGRTFQRSELWNSLTVEENVELGREAGMAGREPAHPAGRCDRVSEARFVPRRWKRMALTGVDGVAPTGRRPISRRESAGWSSWHGRSPAGST